MPFKINISDKSGKTYKLESETEELLGKELNDKIQGKDLDSKLEGYEFEITGTSDSAGFASHKDASGIGLKKLLLTYGKSMNKKPRREGKKKLSNPKPKGLRLRKTVRGKVISTDIIQINLKIVKNGSQQLSEIFPEQNKAKEEPEKKPVEAQIAA
jgi:small subunit ribosomal protein S6e